MESESCDVAGGEMAFAPKAGAADGTVLFAAQSHLPGCMLDIASAVLFLSCGRRDTNTYDCQQHCTSLEHHELRLSPLSLSLSLSLSLPLQP